MTHQRKKLSGLLEISFVIVIVIAELSHYYTIQKNIDHLAHWPKTDGQVTAHWLSPRRTWSITGTYQVADISYQFEATWQTHSMFTFLKTKVVPTPIVGSKIAVFYNPDNPAETVINSPANKRPFYPLATNIILLIGLVIGIVRLVMSNLSKK